MWEHPRKVGLDANLRGFTTCKFDTFTGLKFLPSDGSPVMTSKKKIFALFLSLKIFEISENFHCLNNCKNLILVDFITKKDPVLMNWTLLICCY